MILYNLRTSDLGYRITKFTDGEVESSYLTSDQACDCPAGHRTSCRHRQMLPQMLARHLTNSDLFWDFDRGFSCDINGNAKRETVAYAPAEQDIVTIASMVELSADADVAAEFAKLLHPPVPAGQHTAAESLSPEETVKPSDYKKWMDIIDKSTPTAPDRGWLEPALDKAAARADQMPKWMIKPSWRRL